MLICATDDAKRILEPLGRVWSDGLATGVGGVADRIVPGALFPRERAPRLASVGALWFGYATDAALPIELRDNQSIAADHPIVLERWTTAGAQIHPAPNLVIDPGVIESFLAANRVVYVTGPFRGSSLCRSAFCRRVRRLRLSSG